MCGIAGLYSFYTGSSGSLKSTAMAMADAMMHRGPDDSGAWVHHTEPLALAHRRLSIIDLTPEGRQPMHSPSGRYTIVFNGEIYNFQGLRRELESVGHTFRGRSDTEIMLAAIDEWGLDPALKKFNGMFAFALWDRDLHRIHLVRDRLGKKPLYVGWAGNSFVFGSELKALRAHPAFQFDLSLSALQLYMRYCFVPAPFCIYRGVWTLPAGCEATLNPREIEPGQDISALMKPYWNHSRILEQSRTAMRRGTEAEVADEFEDLLRTCVRERMVADVPLGAFLSGGIDSSTVVALMQQISAQPVKTYTVGFHEPGYDEAGHARKVAAYLGTDHHELYVTADEVLQVIPDLPRIYDEPFADMSAVPTYLVSRFAKKDVTVALSGDGGDELFGGYNRHLQAPKIMTRTKTMPLLVRRWLARQIDKWTTDELDRSMPSIPQFGDKLHKAASILGLSMPDEIYRRLLSHWDDPSSVVVGGEEPEIPLFAPEYKIKAALSFSEKMMAGDALSYLPNDILVKIDRATMAASLEARAPLLDRKMYEFAWTLPETLKIRNGRGKWLLRKVLDRHVPLGIFGRPKQGFSVPAGEWLKGPLREWAEELLQEGRLRRDGFLRPEPVRALWSAHLGGRGNYQMRLWTVLCFQSWLQYQRAS